jgi:hypothetical protein
MSKRQGKDMALTRIANIEELNLICKVSITREHKTFEDTATAHNLNLTL